MKIMHASVKLGQYRRWLVLLCVTCVIEFTDIMYYQISDIFCVAKIVLVMFKFNNFNPETDTATVAGKLFFTKA